MAETDTSRASGTVDNASASAAPSDLSPEDQLKDLSAKALAQYSIKNYNAASELYSQATELQAELNGEMSVDNANLLYDYGKCLFYLAQQTSSVLGGTAASAQLSNPKEKKPKKKKAKTNGAGKVDATVSNDTLTQEPDRDPKNGVADVIPEADVTDETNEEGQAEDKPFFQITGDENWDDSEDEEEEAEANGDGDEQEEEEEDDFATAYELLDLARILYLKKLDQDSESSMQESLKGKYVASIELTPEVRDTKRRISDIYDLQSEVSLEGERYSQAVTDLQACLALKEELEPPESALVAECNYKLSLALEFSSQSQQRDEDGNPVGDMTIDWTIRNNAIAHQEKAIDSCKLRISKETAALEVMEPGKEKDKAMQQIEDVQEMIGEMDVRLAELRKEPVNVKEATDGQKEELAGILGSILNSGKTKEEKTQMLEQATQGANDLSGMVKKRKPKTSETNGNTAGSSGSGKRKVAFVEDTDDVQSKKAKVEDAEDDGK